MRKIGVLNYGLGNMASIENALMKIGAQFFISSDSSELDKCDSLIIPGVGGFNKGMSNLIKDGLDQFVLSFYKKNRPLLGICLGYQMMNLSGTEHGFNKGLEIISGNVNQLDVSKNVLLPNIGWLDLKIAKPSPLLKGIEDEKFYFVHSYAVSLDDKSQLIASTDYGNTSFAAASNNGLAFGVQFHPEKSREPGLQLLKNFIEIN